MAVEAFNSDRMTVYFWDGSNGVTEKKVEARILKETFEYAECVRRNSSNVRLMSLTGSYFGASHAEVAEPGTMSFDVVMTTNEDNDSSLSELQELLLASYRGDTAWSGTYASWGTNKLPLGGRAMLNVVVALQDPADPNNTHYVIYGKACVTELSAVQREGSSLKISVTMSFHEDPTRSMTAPWTPD